MAALTDQADSAAPVKSRRERERKLARDKRKRAAKDEAFLARKRATYHRYASKPENKLKIAARAKVKHLCRTGKMQRGNCTKCDAPNAHAHHHDYSKPLDVIWLCPPCHGLEHRRT